MYNIPAIMREYIVVSRVFVENINRSLYNQSILCCCSIEIVLVSRVSVEILTEI